MKKCSRSPLWAAPGKKDVYKRQILANGLHMQKHFTFHWDALQDYRDEPKS